MPENSIYVEGSILSKLMMGTIGLRRVRANRMLMVMDQHHDKMFNDEIVNAVSSATPSSGPTLVIR